jgi:hypothetical protein
MPERANEVIADDCDGTLRAIEFSQQGLHECVT